MINIPPLILNEFFYPFLKQEYGPILIYFFFTLFTHPFYTIIIPEMYSKLFDFIKKTPTNGLMSFNSIFKIFDEHFIKDKLMIPVTKKDERHYNDEHLYIIFVWMPGGILYTEDKLRILINNWKTKKSFSKTISKSEIPFSEKKEDIVSFIIKVVY